MYEITENGADYYLKQKIESPNFIIDRVDINFNTKIPCWKCCGL